MRTKSNFPFFRYFSMNWPTFTDFIWYERGAKIQKKMWALSKVKLFQVFKNFYHQILNRKLCENFDVFRILSPQGVKIILIFSSLICSGNGEISGPFNSDILYNFHPVRKLLRFWVIGGINVDVYSVELQRLKTSDLCYINNVTLCN